MRHSDRRGAKNNGIYVFHLWGEVDSGAEWVVPAVTS